MQMPAELTALLLPALAAVIVGALVARPIIRWTERVCWVDAPNFRKHHVGRVPLAGGLMVLATTAACVLGFGLWDTPAWQFWLGCGMIFVISFFDDRFPIRARFRFGVQLASGAALATGGILLENLGQPLGPWTLSLGLLAVPFTMLGVAGLTNAFNMLDGLDGLAGGLIAIALFWLAASLTIISGNTDAVHHVQALNAAKVAGIVIGALLVFLGFNLRTPWRSRAAIFMGDGGSMMLGFIAAAYAVYCASGFGASSVPPICVAWIVAMPVIDLLACMIRRALVDKVTPMTPDRKHLHHLVVALGLPVSKAVPLLYAVAFGMGAIGIAGWQLGVPQHWMAAGLALMFLSYLMFSLRTWARLDAQAELRARPSPVRPMNPQAQPVRKKSRSSRSMTEAHK